MTQSFTLTPTGDVENDGWTLVGSNVTEVWEVVGYQADDCYIQSPSRRGSATVSFPIDAGDLPDGAIIDSVTVFIHMKSVAGSGPRTVTVNVLSSENMSQYTSRTLTATSAFTQFEVGTYIKDPLGNTWDIHRINKLRLRVYSLNNLFNAIQISQLYAKVNYHVKPKIQVTEPTGTTISPSPKVKWTYTHEESEPQARVQVKVFTAQQVAAVNTFNPDTNTPIPVQHDHSRRRRNRRRQSDWVGSWSPSDPTAGDPNGQVRWNSNTGRWDWEDDPTLSPPPGWNGENSPNPSGGGGGGTGNGTTLPFDVNTSSQQVYDVVLVGSATEYTIETSLNNDSYRVYVRAWSEHGAKSDWSYRDFTVNAPSPGTPGDDNAGVAGTPGIGVPTAVPDTYTSSAQIRVRDASNLLSVQQADFEIASDPLEYTGTNCTLTRTTSYHFGEGTASMAVTSAASGDMIAETTYVEVAPAIALTLRAQTRSATPARTCELYATFYDASFNLITTSAAASVTDAQSTWTEIVNNISATPVNAVHMKLHYKVIGCSSSETHYIDHVGAMYGTNSAWTDGGHQSRNILSSFLSTGDDPTSSVDSWAQANVATTTQIVPTIGTGAHGERTNQMTYVGASASIAYKATSSVFTTPTTGTNYTLNKPAGVTDNDLLIAFVTSTENGAIVPPSGWTAVNTASVNDGSTDTALWVLKRTATASDPSSWTTGKVTVASSRRTAVVLAYSGAAHADDQFIADSVRTDASGAAVHRTQIVNNTDPNAWRIAAFAASDDASGSTYTANVATPSTAPVAPIRFVAASAKWLQQNQTSSFTLNKPEGVQSGDLMIAAAVFSGWVASVTAPSGWTLIRREHQMFGPGEAHSGDVTVALFKRTAGSSEPTSWTGTHTDWGQPKITQVVAYRNCANASLQFIDEDFASETNFSKVETPEVTNTDSNAWRVCMFGATAPFASSWNGGDVAERCDSSSSLSNFPDTVLQFSDSNGVVSTGNHKRTGTINSTSTSQSNVPSGNFFSAIGWIGLIKPLASSPAQGANETERVDNNNGSSNPWLSTAVYDSNGVIPAGETSLYGQFSGASANSMVSWIGIIRPASSTPQGVASAYTNTWVDISEMDPDVLDLAGRKVTMMASFLGSTSGTPLLGVEFARANQVISESTAQGLVFDTTTWKKSWAVFSIPTGTTRMRPIVAATDRQVGDTVMFDRIALNLGAPIIGETPAWRNGTSRDEHPVWSAPVIQYTDDTGLGFASWADLPGQRIIPPAFRSDTGQLAYIDHSIVPLNVRKYRAQTISYGLRGDTFSSGWGPDSNEVSFTALNWWLKDFTDLSTALRMRVKYDDIEVVTDNTAAVYHPLGEGYPVVLTEGYKADSLTLSIYCDRQEEALLYRLLRSNRTLLLQSDTDYAWWVRPVETLSVTNLAVSQQRRTTDPIKLVTVKFVQVKPED